MTEQGRGNRKEKWTTEIEMKDGRMLSHGRRREGGGRRNDSNKKEERGECETEREMEGREWGKEERQKEWKRPLSLNLKEIRK